MSGRLVGEVHAWLRSPAARGLTPSERMVLSTIAERAHETTREMWSHRGDDCTQFEYLCEVVGLGPAGLTELLKKLAARKVNGKSGVLEVRIEIGKTRAGKPIYAHRGRAIRFRLPPLPASVALPERVGPHRPFTPDEPVDNPVDNQPDGTTLDTERVGCSRGIDPKGSAVAEATGPKGSVTTDPSPSKDTPSKDHSLTPRVPSSHLNLEDTRPRDAPPPRSTRSRHMGFDAEYQDAVITLTRFPDFGEQYIAQARTELGDTSDRQALYIRAAQFAAKGIPE